jgi:flavodoxin
LAKILVAYFSSSEKEKTSNEEKVALELNNFFTDKHYSVKLISLKSKKDLSLKDQFKLEKELQLDEKIPDLSSFDIIIIGSPIVGSLSSAPIVNTFIRTIVKQNKETNSPKFALFSVGVLPGFAVKKMQSLLSMKGIKPIESVALASIFEFDSKKLLEVREFAQKVLEKVQNQDQLS